MYYSHFGLGQPPFKITPDTKLFFPGGNRGATLQALLYAVNSGEGIVKVVGEVGSGKTMLCRMLQAEMPKRIEVVYLANPNVSPEDVLHAIAFDLHLPVQPGDNRLLVMQTLHDHLLRQYMENRRVVVFIEEAQAMPLATLEAIRLLTNLETGKDKLLQIVMFGQPELDKHLSLDSMRQLKERITYSFYLPPLKIDEIRDYLNSRLRACGHRGNDVFQSGAVKEIAKFSRGLLRRVNILADKSLLAAFATGAQIVDRQHVQLAARDSDFARRPVENVAKKAAILAGAVALGLAGWFFWPGHNPWMLDTRIKDKDAAAGTKADPAKGAATADAKPDGAKATATAAVEGAAGKSDPAVAKAGTAKDRAPLLGLEVLTPYLEPMLDPELKVLDRKPR
jgi:type II secretory pathway predicted ATPase ExeA